MIDGEELDNIWGQGFDYAYRSAVEIFKKEANNLNLDHETRDKILDKMMQDWANG